MSLKQYAVGLTLMGAAYGAVGLNVESAAAAPRECAQLATTPADTSIAPVMARAAIQTSVSCIPESTLPSTAPVETTPDATSSEINNSTVKKYGNTILQYCPVSPKKSKEITTECKNEAFDYLGTKKLQDPDKRLRMIAAQKVMGFAADEQLGIYGPKTIMAIQSGIPIDLETFSSGRISAPNKKGLGFVIDQNDQMTYMYENGKLQEAFVVSTGSELNPTANGNFTIQSISNNPGKESLDNPEWKLGKPIYFDGGKAFHQSYTGALVDNRNVTGKKASHGCARTGGEQLDRIHNIISEYAGINWNDSANQISASNPNAFAVNYKKGALAKIPVIVQGQ